MELGAASSRAAVVAGLLPHRGASADPCAVATANRAPGAAGPDRFLEVDPVMLRRTPNEIRQARFGKPDAGHTGRYAQREETRFLLEGLNYRSTLPSSFQITVGSAQGNEL